ncbi:MAG TPA: ATP-binding cassette domain-containing protein [Mycobacteriales bacterium]|jgi:ABC-type lipoprotein export system ATPase subunit|nr:ATP-binding cassette domain-containing protein [Mycobacteriales bacterium]
MTEDRGDASDGEASMSEVYEMEGGAVTEGRGVTVVCERITHLYQAGDEQVVALRDVDLTIPAGSSIALLGPSGCGKSTLMSLLAGLQRPSTGRLFINDEDVTGDPLAGRRLRATTVALLLQEPARALLPYASPRLALENAGDRNPGPTLESFALSEVADRPTRLLSAGQQQRLALAIVMARTPGLLLVDEPTSRLDPSERDVVITTLHTAARRAGSTLVVVTHDPAVADTFERTLSMRDGRVGAEGRDGTQLAVVGADGSIALSGEALEMLPPGRFATVEITAEGILLRPYHEDESP